MPIYEEKLICPLSVRFTQDHIRPVFQDKRRLEDTIKEITTRPGTGDYDLILDTPFPTIEVLRWYQYDADFLEEPKNHWFSLDNRRLYCLQKVAASLWPKRVACTVELLYAARGGLKRKDDSTTVGRSVAIGHSGKQLFDRWDWRQAVAEHPFSTFELEAAVRRRVIDDDDKESIEDLQDAPAPLSMLELFFQGKDLDDTNAAEKATTAPSSKDSTDQTTSPRSVGGSSDGGCGSPATAQSAGASTGKSVSEATPTTTTTTSYKAAANSGNKSKSQQQKKKKTAGKADDVICGYWTGPSGEYYEVTPSEEEEDTFNCVKTEASGTVRAYTLWHDKSTDAVWWGTAWKMYLDLAEIRSGSEMVLKWRNGEDDGTQEPRSIWNFWQEEEEEQNNTKIEEKKGRSQNRKNKKGIRN